MINITELVMGVDLPGQWPLARKWLLANYGERAYLPQRVVCTGAEQEPEVRKFDTRWALIPFAIDQPDGASHTYFYLDFQDPNDEMVFILKWL